MMSKAILWRVIIVVALLYPALGTVTQSSRAGRRTLIDIAWSPDGSKLAVAYWDVLDILNANDLQLLASYTGNAYLSELAWSPDSSRIAVSFGYRGSSIKVIDASNGTLTAELQSIGDRVTSVAWSSDGSLIAGGVAMYTGSLEENWLQIWDVASSNSYFTERVRVDDVAWGPNSDLLVISSIGGKTSIIDLATSTSLILEDQNVPAVVWNSNGNYVATGNYSGEVRIWNAASGELVNTFDFGARSSVSDIAWSQDGSKIAIGYGGHLDVWDFTSSQQLIDLAITEGVNAVDWSSDSCKLAYDNNAALAILEFCEPPPPTCDAEITTSDIPALISAINTANTSGQPTTICLAEGSTYTFTAINNNKNALPRITGNITLEGNGATLARSGSTQFRFLEVRPGGSLTVHDVTFANGLVSDDQGGAILNNGGTLAVHGSTFTGNQANTGGAISNDETTAVATITDSTFTNNSAANGGALDNDTDAEMSVVDSTFTGNSATNHGGMLFNEGLIATFSGNVVTGSSAANDGGAIQNTTGGDLTIADSVFTNNSGDDGGAIRNTASLTIEAGTEFNGNGVYGTSWGGAIYNASGATVTITGATFTANVGAYGGAIRNHGTMTLTEVMIDGGTPSTTNNNNVNQQGGAIMNSAGTLVINDSQLMSNQAAGEGGAIYNGSSASLTLDGSLVQANHTAKQGGAIRAHGPLTITDSQFLSNTATTNAGAIYIASGVTATAGNSCFAGNASTAVHNAGSVTQNFGNNWWGAANGPSGAGPGSGDSVSTKIDFGGFITTGCPH